MSQKFALRSLPTFATPEDYERASEELEQMLMALPDMVAVYRYGGITAPGISDLDRLVVTAGDRRIPSIWPRLSERTRYLAMHTPARVDSRTFARHRWFAELGKLELVGGSRVPVAEPPFPEYSEPLLAAEALVVTALKLLKLSTTGRAKVRPWLCELANLRLDLRLARLSPGDAPTAWMLADEVGLLRRDWWELDDTDRRSRFQRLLTAAPSAVFEALNSMSAGGHYPSVDQELQLSAPWQNVKLVPSVVAERMPWLSALVGYSRHLGEVRWRSVRRFLPVPPAVIGLLVESPPGDYAAFRAERDQLLRSHKALLAMSAGYSGLSIGSVFVH